MLDRIFSFCINYLDVFDGLVIGILFTLGCQWAQRKLSKPPQAVNIMNVGAPIEFDGKSQDAVLKTMRRNKEAVERCMGIPEEELHQP